MSCRVRPLGKAGGAALKQTVDYFTSKTSKYYAGDGSGEKDGKFLGRGAAALKFGTGAISKRGLERMLGGQHPITGEAVVQGAGERHRPGVEILLAAPKSVSLLWALCPDPSERERIEAALTKARDSTLSRIEKEIWTRRGKGGATAELAAGGVVAAFNHGDTREGDPHWHEHLLIANIAVREDGTVGTIDQERLFHVHKLISTRYEREIARELRGLGYVIDEDESAPGHIAVAGISRPLVDHFSKRQAEVEAKVNEMGGKVSAKQHARISTMSKKAKSGPVDRDDDFERWQQEANDAGTALDFAGLKKAVVPAFLLKTDATIVDELLANQSVFDARELEERVARVLQFDATADQDADAVEKRTRRILQSSDLLPVEDRLGNIYWTTRERRALEEHAVAWAKQTAEDRVHANQVNEELLSTVLTSARANLMVKAGDKWNEKGWVKQEAAIRHLVKDSGQCAVLKGYAGAGKSTSMLAAVEAFEKSGMTVFGAAVSWKAAKNLQEEAGAESKSLASLLQLVRDGKSPLNAHSVVILDEAGMAGSVDTAALLKEAERVGAKVILAGEREQLQAVAAGGLLSAVEKALAGNEPDDEGIAVLSDINRQRETWHRDAVLAMREGRAGEAITAFEEHGLLNVTAERQDALKAAAEAWLEARAEHGEDKILMMASTRGEVKALNTLARSGLRERGVIGAIDFAMEVTVDETAGAKGKYCIRETRLFAEGERVVFKKNDKRLGVINGDVGTIKSVKRDRAGVLAVVVERADGRTVSFKSDAYDRIDHCSAVSVHASQGRTVEQAIFVLDAERGMLDRHLAYVGISRSKGTTRLFCTDADKDDLVVQMARERIKGTTLDYAIAAGEREELVNRASMRGMVAETVIQAIEWKSHARLRALLVEDPDRANLAESKAGNTPLHLAVMRGDKEAVEILLEFGADPAKGNRFGQTPRADARKHPAIALLFGVTPDSDTTAGAPPPREPPARLTIASDLTRKPQPSTDEGGASVAPFGADVQQAMFAALMAGEAAGVRDAIKKGAKPKGIDGMRRTFLHLATQGKNADLVTLGIRNLQPDLNSVDDNGHTALHYAAILGDVVIFRLLVDAGADPRLNDSAGESPFDILHRKGLTLPERTVVAKLPTPKPAFARTSENER